jgi:four helix bundle protein
MDQSKPHKKLNVWQLSMELCRHVYTLCGLLPDDEKYGLASQMKRAAVSIPSNIAEGAARNSTKEFVQFISIAQGSLSELDTQVELCAQYLGLIPEGKYAVFSGTAEQISKMLTALKKSMKSRP